MIESHLAHIARLEAKFGPESEEVATALNTLTFLICQYGEPADAVPYFERSLSIRKALHGPASLLPQLAQWIGQKGPVNFKHLEPYILARLEIKAAAWGEIDPRVAEECDRVAGQYLHRGEPSQAKPFSERALAIRAELNGPDSDEVAQSLQKLADVCLRADERALAGRHRTRCIAVTERVHGARSREVAGTLISFALAAIAASNQPQRDSVRNEMRRDATTMCERALSIEEALFGPDSLQVQRTLEAVARSYLDCRDFSKAEALVERLLDICERTYGNDAAALLWILTTLAQIYAYNRSQRAEPMLERCFTILRSLLDAKRPTLTIQIENLPGDRAALYSSNSSGILEMLIETSERIHYNTRKRWEWG